MAKTWTIVIFTDENTVEAVPSNWLINNMCYWPSLPSDKLTAAIRNHEEPNTCWPSYLVRVVRNGTFDNYLIAKEKCRKAEYSSDINSDVSNRAALSKRKITKKTYGSSFEESNLSSSDDNDNDNQIVTKLPTPPCMEQTNEVNSFIKTKPKKKSNDEATNNISTLLNTEKFRKGTSQSNDFDNNEDFNSNGLPFMSECKCCPVHLQYNCEKYFKEIIRQQNFLKANMWHYTDVLQELTTSINNFVANNNVNHVQEEISFLQMFDFPIRTEEDLTRVEEHLYLEKNFNAAINELSKIGGHSIYNFIQRALQLLITNDLAATYSWLGRRAKKTFCKLKVADLIIEYSKLHQ